MEVVSEGLGHGSEFCIRLPLPPDGTLPAAAITPEPATVASVVSRKVLVVDDNIDSAASIGMLLGLDGHQVREAHDGPTALTLLAAERPDLVLLDIGMPGMDGHEVARRIRQLPGMQDLILVAMTGYGQEEDRRRTREAGFDVHLVKPVDIDELRRLVAAAQSNAG